MRECGRHIILLLLLLLFFLVLVLVLVLPLIIIISITISTLSSSSSRNLLGPCAEPPASFGKWFTLGTRAITVFAGLFSASAVLLVGGSSDGMLPNLHRWGMMMMVVMLMMMMLLLLLLLLMMMMMVIVMVTMMMMMITTIPAQVLALSNNASELLRTLLTGTNYLLLPLLLAHSLVYWVSYEIITTVSACAWFAYACHVRRMRGGCG
jgi:hypothetical protein